MCVKIGIPRSLFYYKFISFWEKFFSELGAEVIVSEQTNKRILDDGVKACVDEACLPIKLFYGHVINLKGKVDYILVPRFTSISKNEYICPEFGGLPDMIRHTLKDLPVLIDTEVNMRSSKKGGLVAAVQAGAMLGVDRRKAIKAYWKALEYQQKENRSFIYRSSEGENCPQRSPQRIEVVGHPEGENCPQRNSQRIEVVGHPEGENCPQRNSQRIGVIGHSYNIYDRYISMDLLGKLEKYGAQVRTMEMIEESEINVQAGKLDKPMFWNYGRKAYGAALYMAEVGMVDGFICVTSFGCGIDSFVNDLIERNIRRKYSLPFITISIDEHSGEAGFNTRLEAFVDMLQWRSQNENYISASG